MSQEPIIFERQNGIAKVTLNRPEVLNSFNQPMFDRFLAVLDEVRADRSLRTMHLTGSGRAFSAGQDISGGVPEGPYGEHLAKNWNRVARGVRTLEIPVVCAVNGVAAGAGANLALACDFVIAAQEASFIQAFINLGLVPDTAGTWTLPRLVGTARATALMMLGERLPAPMAAEWGLIYKVVPLAALEEESMALASRLAKMPTLALGFTKRLINSSLQNGLDAQLAMEAELQTLAGDSAHHKEGVSAFREKRSPQFT